MKIFGTRPDKQNLSMSSTMGRFYPKNRRPSQMGTINDMLSLNENKSFNNTLQNLKSLRHLSHFKKNNNMIQTNIEQQKRTTMKCVRVTRKKIIDCPALGEMGKKANNAEEKNKSLTVGLLELRYAKPTFPLDLIKKFKMYPRYKVLQLYALYRSILQYSQRNPRKFLQAFESALNYRKIIVKSEIVRKNVFQQKQMQFKDFLQVYKKMEDLMFIQSVTDYLQIIFETHLQQKMSYQTVYSTLLKRSQHEDAARITNIIYEKMSLDKEEYVQLKGILQLCEIDIEFCAIFSKLYHQEAM